MKVNAATLISEIVSMMDKTIKVKSLTETTTTAELTICGSLKWLVVGDKLIQGLVGRDIASGTVTGINGQVVTVDKSTLFDWTNMHPEIMTNFVFQSGTKNVVTDEWQKKGNIWPNKIPFVVLSTPTTQNEMPHGSSVETELNCLMYFIVVIEYNKVTEEVINSEYIPPVMAMVQEFKDTIKRIPWLDGYNVRYEDMTLTRFSEIDKNGQQKAIIDSDLGGIQTRFTLPVFKRAQKCNC